MSSYEVGTTPDGHRTYTFSVGASVFEVCPEHGARLMRWRYAGAPIIHWPEDASTRPMAKVRGGNPILFPFSARTFHEGTQGRWRTPDGRVLDMPMHGFARQGDFRIDAIDDAGFSATLEPSPEADAAYPYAYRFRVTYAFAPEGLTVTLSLENKGQVGLPWCAGHHFYFSMPSSARGARALELSAQAAFRHAPTGGLVAEALPPGPYRFDDPDLVDRIHAQLDTPSVRFGPFGDQKQLEMRFGAASFHPWSTLVTWTEASDSPFYCVEPWMGPPNAPEHGHGLVPVAPGETSDFSVQLELTD